MRAWALPAYVIPQESVTAAALTNLIDELSDPALCTSHVIAVLLLSWLYWRRRHPVKVDNAKISGSSENSDTEVSCDWEINMHDIKRVFPQLSSLVYIC